MPFGFSLLYHFRRNYRGYNDTHLKGNTMKKTTGYTPEEKFALATSRLLLTRSMQDDVSIEAFNLALENYNAVVQIVVVAHSTRNAKKSLLKRIFNR